MMSEVHYTSYTLVGEDPQFVSKTRVEKTKCGRGGMTTNSLKRCTCLSCLNIMFNKVNRKHARILVRIVEVKTKRK